MAADGWHPPLNDPLWFELAPKLDAEIAARPTGDISLLARRAAVRVELAADPLVWVSNSSPMPRLVLDTRPWFELAAAHPYFVEIEASLDDTDPIIIAAAFSGQQCEGRVFDVAWPRAVGLGAHRVMVSIRIAYLAKPPSGRGVRCAFSRRDMTHADEWPRLTGSVVAVEHRRAPSLAFALLADDVFVNAAKRTPANAFDARLPSIPLDTWLHGVAPPRDVPAGDTPRVGWITVFCNEDEALWWHPFGSFDSQGESYWRASSTARGRRRELCAVALAQGHSTRMGVRVAVATLLEEEGDWEWIEPRLYDAFVEGYDNWTEVGGLGDLPTAIGTSEDLWPRTRLFVSPADVTIDPPAPIAGDVVRVRVNFHNVGERPVPRAHGDVTILLCCGNVRIVHRFAGDIPVGGVLTTERLLTWPPGGVEVVTFVWPTQPIDREEGGWRRWPFRDWDLIEHCADVSFTPRQHMDP
jgi:hypothetical protein